MSFIAKSPLTISEVETPPSVPKPGTRGFFAGQDGWYDVDSDGNTRKIVTEDESSVKSYIPEKCNATEDAVWSFEFCKNPISTEGVRSFWYSEGNLNFDIEIDSSAVGFQDNKVVFFNPKTGDKIVCYCFGYLNLEEVGFEYNFDSLEKPLDVTNLEDFKKKYTHCGVYSGEYKWIEQSKVFGNVETLIEAEKENAIAEAKAYTDEQFKKPFIPKECNTGESSLFVFEAKKTYHTEDFFVPTDVPTGTDTPYLTTYEHMDIGTEVFLVDNGGVTIKGRVEDCSDEPEADGFYRPLMVFEENIYEQQFDEWTGEVLNPVVPFSEFVSYFTTIIIGSDKYEWKPKDSAFKQVEVTMDVNDTDQGKAASIVLVSALNTFMDETTDRLEHKITDGLNEVRLEIGSARQQAVSEIQNAQGNEENVYTCSLVANENEGVVLDTNVITDMSGGGNRFTFLVDKAPFWCNGGEHFVGFYNTETEKYETAHCVGFRHNDGFVEIDFVIRQYDTFSVEDWANFYSKYSKWTEMSFEYVWQDKNTFLEDVNASIQQAILDSWEVGV